MVVRGCDSGWEGDISPCEGDACGVEGRGGVRSGGW